MDIEKQLSDLDERGLQKEDCDFWWATCQSSDGSGMPDEINGYKKIEPVIHHLYRVLYYRKKLSIILKEE